MERTYVGIDGEGVGRDPHRYTLLAWSDKTGTDFETLEDKRGLSTVACLEFLLAIPKRCKPFAFAFGYDLTKILTDLSDRALYYLFRPELRRGVYGPKPVLWNRYLLNLQGTKFTLTRMPRVGEKKNRVPKVVIWDVFKFFQSKFTKALETWKIAEADDIAAIEAMKNKRGSFSLEERGEIRKYCLSECREMARLAETLVTAHREAGLELKSFYGAGSTASVMLKSMGIDKMNRAAPEEMQDAVGRAFFGGRFEHSIIGEVKGEVWGYDISSAYPYQTTFLPCLEHGFWRQTKNELEAKKARAALVHYEFARSIPYDAPWGPFPWRDAHGSITFPYESDGGWVWRDEFFMGKKCFPKEVRFVEAWVLDSACKCPRPFRDIPRHYMQRLRWGKEGKGIVLKLGVNSVYGKLAQSLGEAPPFQCWIWAGMITSGTRAQILELLYLHKNRRNMLAVATDGVYTRERLDLKRALPKKTGMEGWVEKPLGGWEEKHYPRGLFFMRPGIYFPLEGTEKEMAETRARGIGKATMRESIKLMTEAWMNGAPHVQLPNVQRFHGAKTSITISGVKSGKETFTRSKKYGEWDIKEILLSFSPLPKRNPPLLDKYTLPLRSMKGEGLSSVYKKSKSMTKEKIDGLRVQDEVSEQPDGVLDMSWAMAEPGAFDLDMGGEG